MPFYPYYLLDYYSKIKHSKITLNPWEVPSTDYESFLTGMTKLYDTAPAYDKHYSAFWTRYFQEGISGSTSGGTSTSGSSVYVTGGTANGTNSTVIFNNSSGGSFTLANSALLFNDAFVSGGTLNPVSGVVTFINTTGGTFEVSGFDGFSSYWSGTTDGNIVNSGLTNSYVGIGTSDPNENLTVVGSISATTNLYFREIDGGRF